MTSQRRQRRCATLYCQCSRVLPKTKHAVHYSSAVPQNVRPLISTSDNDNVLTAAQRGEETVLRFRALSDFPAAAIVWMCYLVLSVFQGTTPLDQTVPGYQGATHLLRSLYSRLHWHICLGATMAEMHSSHTCLTSTEIYRTLLSASMILLIITLKMRMILQNIWSRFVGYVCDSVGVTSVINQWFFFLPF